MLKYEQLELGHQFCVVTVQRRVFTEAILGKNSQDRDDTGRRESAQQPRLAVLRKGPQRPPCWHTDTEYH